MCGQSLLRRLLAIVVAGPVTLAVVACGQPQPPRFPTVPVVSPGAATGSPVTAGAYIRDVGGDMSTLLHTFEVASASCGFAINTVCAITLLNVEVGAETLARDLRTHPAPPALTAADADTRRLDGALSSSVDTALDGVLNQDRVGVIASLRTASDAMVQIEGTRRRLATG